MADDEQLPSDKESGTAALNDQAPTASSPQASRSVKVGLKHILVAAGVLVFPVGGFAFDLLGDRPDFVCRLNGDCGHSGRCVGVQSSCRLGTTADCQASDICRKEGSCSAGPSSCRAATDQDCASSEVCRNQSQCVQFEDSCVTERQRAGQIALREQEVAAKTVSEYLPLVSSVYAKFEASKPHLEAAEWGTAKFNERVLPAAVIRASVTITDRLAGKRYPVCTIMTAISDKEFGRWRESEGFMCDGSAARGLAKWRTKTGFSLGGAWAETPVVALGNSVAKSP